MKPNEFIGSKGYKGMYVTNDKGEKIPLNKVLYEYAETLWPVFCGFQKTVMVAGIRSAIKTPGFTTEGLHEALPNFPVPEEIIWTKVTAETVFRALENPERLDEILREESDEEDEGDFYTDHFTEKGK